MIRKRIPGLGESFEPTPREPFPHNVGLAGVPETERLIEALVLMATLALGGALGFRMWRAYGPRSWKYRLRKRRHASGSTDS